MTMAMSQTTTSREAAYGWFADALGGVATVVLAIIGLAGAHAEMITAIATIVPSSCRVRSLACKPAYSKTPCIQSRQSRKPRFPRFRLR
jgi:hypothetical protein